VIECQYTFASDFKDGLAVVSKGGHYYYINSSNKIMIQGSFERAFPFNGNKAIVVLNGKKRYIDRNGELLNEIPVLPKF
jgi:outer membrane protease